MTTLWLMLAAVEVTSLIRIETIFGRKTWLEDLAIVGAMYTGWYKFCTYRVVKGILLSRWKSKEKESLKRS
jgi:hypothetical protein